MLVYVINKNGQPLMPTSRFGKVRRLLKNGQAKCVKRCPFVIQLMYEAENNVQEITLGVDAGSKHIGLSATSKEKVLYESDIELRNDVVELLSTRREARISRRFRKTRYRKARFFNRKKHEGWLAPSIMHKIKTHLSVIDRVHQILPIGKIIVEVASFDIQKIKNPDIQGKEHQQGEQLNFWNVREYVLFRDGYTCQCCKGKSKDKILNVHHIESRKTGSNAPNNLITLCESCHTGHHQGTVELPKSIKRGMKFNDTVFMGIMRWAFYNKLKQSYRNISLTYGYITKNLRIKHELPKEHYIDARCISGNPLAKSDGTVYYQKKIRCHNRQLHKFNASKGNRRKTNQLPYLVKGFRLWDKVVYNKGECFIQGRRATGFFQLKKLDGTLVHVGVNCKKLKLLEKARGYIIESRSPCAVYNE